MAKIDITSKVERLEAFEDRLGVSIESYSVFLEAHDSDSIYISVYGEFSTKSGTTLNQDTSLIVAAYDSEGRIVGSSDTYFGSEDFFGMEVFDLTFRVPVKNISKIRIYPKKS